MDIENLLYDEIVADFENLRTKTPGSDEHKAITDELAKLMDRAIEMKKIENESKEKAEARESEQLLKEKQFKDEKRDRLIKNVINVAGVVLPLMVTILE